MNMGSEMPGAMIRHELERLRKEWWWFLVLGILLVLLGTACIAVPVAATLATVAVIGVLMIVGGIAQIVSSFWSGHWSGFLLHLLIGILYVVVGGMILHEPANGSVALTLVMSVFFIVTGIFRIIASLQIRFANWGWWLLNGLITLILGIMIWTHMPEMAFWVLGLFVGIEMIFNGWAWVMLAIGVRTLPSRS
jgi:uncharacterized membrane protein HdeD (DUF308 family)